MVQWQHAGLQINRSSDRSCTWGMIHIKIHLISPGYPRRSIALQCRIVAFNTIHSSTTITTICRRLSNRITQISLTNSQHEDGQSLVQLRIVDRSILSVTLWNAVCVCSIVCLSLPASLYGNDL